MIDLTTKLILIGIWLLVGAISGTLFAWAEVKFGDKDSVINFKTLKEVILYTLVGSIFGPITFMVFIVELFGRIYKKMNSKIVFDGRKK